MITPTEISYPFDIDSTGAIKTSTDPTKIAEDHLVGLLGTRFGERVMRPTYGSEVGEELFDFAGVDGDTLVISAINEAVSQWEPGVQIISVDIVPASGGTPESTVSVNINFRVIGTKTTAEHNPIYTATIKVGGTVTDSRIGTQ